jgi:CDGSH-type Zn-finger protein
MVGGNLMTAENGSNTNSEKKIVIRPNGSYKVFGNIPLCRKVQVVSEYGEPLTWQKTETFETEDHYSLCRCGHSEDKPFCDGLHRKMGFDGTETADTGPTSARQETLHGGTHIVVKYDDSLCMDSGFCGTRLTNIHNMMSETSEPQVRSLLMAMIERCPSGAYVYSINKNEADIEPDLPQQIAATTEITSDGPIEGPLWVTGNILIERSDGQPFETRNRVTLCNCGKSSIKPLCDGTHRKKH